MLSLKQTSEKIGVTPSALRHRIRSGTLKAVKKGRDWFISEVELSKLLPTPTPTKEGSNEQE